MAEAQPMRHPGYSETQTMWLLWVLLPASTAAIVGAVLAGTGATDWCLAVGVVAVQLGALALLGRFTVEVDEQHLAWRYGLFGRPRWRLPLAEIMSVEPTRSHWTEGWGIRRTREGMLYNATGLGAVRLHCRDGRRLRLGSTDPQRLAAFISARLAR